FHINFLNLFAESRCRLAVCGVALEIAQYKDLMRKVDSAQLDALLSRLDTFCKIDTIIERVSYDVHFSVHRDLGIGFTGTHSGSTPPRPPPKAYHVLCNGSFGLYTICEEVPNRNPSGPFFVRRCSN
ncbi:hypothetical protein OSTOST_18179, partial [Ostertagia ostertagi]